MGRMAVAKADDKLKCLRCGGANQSNFYSTKNPARRFWSKIPYCKECVHGFYKEYYKKYKDMNMAMYYLCRKIDIPYIHENYKGAVKNINNPDAKIQGEEAIIGAYMKGFGFSEQNGWGSSFDDSQGENEIEGITSFAEITKVKRKAAGNALNSSKENDDKYEIIEYDTQELLQKWGNFDVDDLVFLESEYLDWDEKLGGISENKSVDTIVKQICYETNEIRKERESGATDTKRIAALQNLLKTSGLIEKQDEVKESRRIGMDIKDIEFYRPIKTPDEHLSDVDNVEQIIFSIIGGLSRSLNKENDFTRKFDEIMAPYGVDLIENVETPSEPISDENVGD